MLSKKQVSKMEKEIDRLCEETNYFEKYRAERISFGPVNLYLGVGKYVRIYPFCETGSIVIASVEVEERKQGKGFFKDFFERIENIAEQKGMRLVFESLVNFELEDWLANKGYTLYGQEKHMGCSYFKDVKEYNMINKEKIEIKNHLNEEIEQKNFIKNKI